jgi:hypothetical protein
MKRLLITFGCSWTFGVGVGYTHDMSSEEYKDIAWDKNSCNQLSFRGLLSKKYNLININFAEGASSNQRQFRKAKLFFSSSEFKRIQTQFDEILVLWGITSTARNELFFNENRELINFFYGDSTKSIVSKIMAVDCYDHSHEVFCLATEMLHWNDFFKNLNVKNLWFDTFNHHDYHIPTPNILHYEKMYKLHAGNDWPSWEQFIVNEFDVTDQILDELFSMSRFDFSQFIINQKKIPNLISKNNNARDLLSILAITNGQHNIDKKYHKSIWQSDSNRVEYLTKIGVLNPLSMHPTQLGHQQITQILSGPLEQLMNM